VDIIADRYSFEGHIDLYGYHAGACGWFVGGWISYPWPPGRRPSHASAVFADAAVALRTHAVFYQREDVAGRGIGFVFFLPAEVPTSAPLRAMAVQSGSQTYTITPTPGVLVLDEAQIVGHLLPILAGGPYGSQQLGMEDLLLSRPASASASASVSGGIDTYGYHAAAGGWLFSGWIEPAGTETLPPGRLAAAFQEGDLEGEAFVTLFPRPDLGDGVAGIAFYLRAPAARLGHLCLVSFEADARRAILPAAPGAVRLGQPELVSRLRPLLAQADATRQRDALLELLARLPYTGDDTLAGMATPVFLEIDEAVICGGDGLLLMGWCLRRPADVREMRLRSGPLTTTLDLDSGIRIDRPDVIEGFAAQGFDDPLCGFMVFLAGAVVPNETLYIEVETQRGEVGYRSVPPPKLAGMGAIKRLLGGVDVRFTELGHAFDRVLGPAVERLNRQRLATRPAAAVVEYGAVPKAPRVSVVVPLYGRLDFVEYQMALFSAYPGSAEVEFIYVLDDPPRRREAQFLFASVYERFRLPFRAVLLDRNLGFAPASNAGLAQASGTFVAFVNSDVFPGTPDWLERLAARLAADPTLGVVGPTLLFEDGSVQHRGMYFERLPEFGNWHFGMHHGKGKRRPPSDGAVQRCLSITGACMLMRRALANEVGGFDETYAIGDFEDSDLCMKVQALGHWCGVDTGVHLFHLERKSQAAAALGWRMNLTLYNAWQHERRWGRVIATMQAA
jgi:GT2 family glycosyltransferase